MNTEDNSPDDCDDDDCEDLDPPHPPLILSNVDRDAFLDSLANPRPNEKLRAALRRRRTDVISFTGNNDTIKVESFEQLDRILSEYQREHGPIEYVTVPVSQYREFKREAEAKGITWDDAAVGPVIEAPQCDVVLDVSELQS